MAQTASSDNLFYQLKMPISLIGDNLHDRKHRKLISNEHEDVDLMSCNLRDKSKSLDEDEEEEDDDDKCNTNTYKKQLAQNRQWALRSRQKRKMHHIKLDLRIEMFESLNKTLKKRIERVEAIKHDLNTYVSKEKEKNSNKILILEHYDQSTARTSTSISEKTFNIPSSLLFNIADIEKEEEEEINEEKRPIQEENKCASLEKKQQQRQRRKRGRSRLSNESEDDRQLSQSLSRLYQKLEQNNNENDKTSNVSEKEEEDEVQNQLNSGLLEEFFTLITQDERSLLLSCSNDFMVDNAYQSQDQTRNSLLSSGKVIDWSTVNICLNNINNNNNLNVNEYTSENEIERLLNISDENSPLTASSLQENILI
jgi:hypothetical protein